MVAVGITRKNPDYFAVSVFNEAFGGGFSSRLFNEIRNHQRARLREWAAEWARAGIIPECCG